MRRQSTALGVHARRVVGRQDAGELGHLDIHADPARLERMDVDIVGVVGIALPLDLHREARTFVQGQAELRRCRAGLFKG